MALELGNAPGNGIESVIWAWRDGLLDNNVHRPTEAIALRNLAKIAKLFKDSGHFTDLTVLHRRVVCLDRAVKRHHPTLSRDAQLQWIAYHGALGVQATRDYLAHADAIITLRDWLGLETGIRDLSAREARRMTLPQPKIA